MAATMTISIEEETVTQAEALAELMRARTRQNWNRSSITREAIRQMHEREYEALKALGLVDNEEPAIGAAGAASGENVAG